MDEGKPRIVIIDDCLANIRVLQACLGNQYDVGCATTGRAGIALVTREQPDMVLLDVMMPEMDGYEVCVALKAAPETRDIPVIFVTALDGVNDEARGLTLGAVDYMTKPISPEIVRARIKLHIELKRSRDQLERQSTTDGLTGIANRRRFDEVLAQEWSRASRTGATLSLIIADIDFFKNYNDHYGHLAGDDCLKKAARAFLEIVPRKSDLVARYGGEEFVILLPETDGVGATAVAGRLKDAIDALGLPHTCSSVSDRVTISLGVATMVPVASMAASSLIATADRMLYRAKADGRNQIVAAAA